MDKLTSKFQPHLTVMEIVEANLRPEFINRIDDLVVFHLLRKDQTRSIATIQIQHLKERLYEREINFEISVQALDLLGEPGFDPVYGARPLKRVIQNQRLK